MDTEYAPIVIDNGAGFMRVGFGGDDNPKSIFPTLVSGDRTYGEEALLSKNGIFRAIENRGTINWDNLEQLWHHSFYNVLRVAPEEHPVFLTMKPLAPKAYQEKTMQIMFETFNVPACKTEKTFTLAIYSSGRTTGLVVEHEACYTVPIFEGAALPHAILQMDWGGKDVSLHLCQLLLERGYTIPEDIIEQIKRTKCYVATDFATELKSPSNETYTLPDGRVITLGAERFKCTETVFSPLVTSTKGDCIILCASQLTLSEGLAELIQTSIEKCDIDLRNDFYPNVVLTGGTTLFTGFPERIDQIVKVLDPRSKVIAPPNRDLSTWIGASIMSSLSTFQSTWYSKEEYDESGPSIVHRKCFCGGGSSSTVSLSVGGARDVKNFRQKIETGHVPYSSDVTVEGLFAEYFFDTSGTNSEEGKLFSPAYAMARSKNPLTAAEELYLSVGLKSNLKQENVNRPNLDLVILLDISGSMESSMHGSTTSKLQAAKEAVLIILKHLTAEDRVGVVLFDDRTETLSPLKNATPEHLASIKTALMGVKCRGGTELLKGLNGAVQLYQGISSENQKRILFVTDGIPNSSEERSLEEATKKIATTPIYVTFIGVGIDFNSRLVQQLCKARGANYFTVSSAKEFHEKMEEHFDHMVTPIVFDLVLRMHTDNWEIEEIYGAPASGEEAGDILRVTSLYPSTTSSKGEGKGGIILLKIKQKNSSDQPIKLTASWEDRNGKRDSTTATINPAQSPGAEVFQTKGIRKAVVLVRYVRLLLDWIAAQEKNSVGDMQQQLDVIKKYIESEIDVLEDNSLEEELKIIDSLKSWGTQQTEVKQSNTP